MEYYKNRLSAWEHLIQSLIPDSEGSHSTTAEITETVKNPFSNEESNQMYDLFSDLEKELSSELQHHMDTVFLNLYIKENLIPRGLRSNCTPSFKNDEALVNSWKCILEKCSFDLMSLLIDIRHKIILEVSKVIEEILVKLEPFKKHHDYQKINLKIIS